MATLSATLTVSVPVLALGGVTTNVYSVGLTVTNAPFVPALSTMSLAAKSVTASLKRKVSINGPAAKPPALSVISIVGNCVSMPISRSTAVLLLPAWSMDTAASFSAPCLIAVMS